eukprot:3504002-Lingulodinium_polyedra.AAC.1
MEAHGVDVRLQVPVSMCHWSSIPVAERPLRTLRRTQTGELFKLLAVPLAGEMPLWRASPAADEAKELPVPLNVQARGPTEARRQARRDLRRARRAVVEL